MTKLIVYLLLTAAVTACTSTPERPEQPEQPAARPSRPAGPPRIDFVGIQHTLNMDRAADELGYEEKTFGSCEIGNGFSHTDNCATKYFVVINFQLSCRATEEVSPGGLSEAEIEPISNRTVDWTMVNQHGRTNTDFAGYGQIRMVTERPSKAQRLKLNIGREFLYMEAGDITRVVAPPSWCHKL